MCNSSFCCCQSSRERLNWASKSPARTCSPCFETVLRDSLSRTPALRSGELRLCGPPAVSSRWIRNCWNTGCAPWTETGRRTWDPWRLGIRADWAGRSWGGWRCQKACARRPLTWRPELCCQPRWCQISFSFSSWSCRCQTSSHSWGPASNSFLYLN